MPKLVQGKGEGSQGRARLTWLPRPASSSWSPPPTAAERERACRSERRPGVSGDLQRKHARLAIWLSAAWALGRGFGCVPVGTRVISPAVVRRGYGEVVVVSAG